MDRQDIIKRLSAFIENETRLCSMDFDFVEIARARQSSSKLGIALA